MTDLIERVFHAGFRFDLALGAPQLVRVVRGSGAEMPPALLEEVRVNRGELLAHLATSAREAETEGESTSGTYCATCAATVYTTSPEVQRMCHQVTCPHWREQSGVGPDWLAKERSAAEWRNRKTG